MYNFVDALQENAWWATMENAITPSRLSSTAQDLRDTKKKKNCGKRGEEKKKMTNPLHLPEVNHPARSS